MTKEEHERELNRKRVAAWLARPGNKERNRAKTKAWGLANPERKRALKSKWLRSPRGKMSQRRSRLRNYYGITLDQWNVLFDTQGMACAGCGVDTPGARDWHTDHCHTTGAVRGILCRGCNLALGHVCDNSETLHNLARYLEKSRGFKS